MSQVPVYKAELDDGVGEAVRSTASIAYASVIEPIGESYLAKLKDNIFSTHATNQNQFDLYYLKAILATAGWNKNDDVFDRLEIWLARATAEDKPFNLEHDPRRVRGHITGNYAVDEKNNIISDTSTIDELPDKYHLVTSAVLYKFIKSPDEELTKEMEKIITEIAEGKWFVSMECLFNTFDYAVASSDGKTNIIKRDEKSAFLTKHLRAYGGTGKYQDNKIGRVMRNIVFSGKGLVLSPANSDSIIFQNTAYFKNFSNLYTDNLSMGYIKVSNDNIIKESNLMATETELLQARIKSLEDSLVTASNNSKEYEKRLQDMNEKQVQAKVSELDNQIKTKDEKITALASQVKTEQDARTGAEAKVKELTDKNNALETELNKSKTEQVKASRINSWVNHTGVEVTIATKVVDKLVKLSDEEFKEFLETQPAKATKTEDKKDTPQAAAAATLNNVVDDKKTAPLATDGVNSGVEATQAALSDFLGKAFLGKTIKNTKKKE